MIKSQNNLFVGFGSANITPDSPVGLTGYGNHNVRISTGKLSDLFVKILAFRSEDGSAALVISADLMNISSSWTEILAQWCEENVGVPAANVIFSCIHQHAIPYITDNKVESMAIPRIHAAIRQAIAVLTPADMYISSVETNAMNFVRHYWNKEGLLVTPNHNTVGGGLVGHESEPDNVIQLLKFKRGEKKIFLLLISRPIPIWEPAAGKQRSQPTGRCFA